MKHRQFILKVIRIRRRLIDAGHSKLNLFFCHKRMQELERWLKFYPKATDAQLEKFFHRNRETIAYLMPGKNCKAHQKLTNQFTELL